MLEDTRQVLRRRARRALVVLAGAALLGLLALGGAWLWLTSDAGRAFLRAQVVSAAEGALAGRLSIDALELDGETLRARGLRLFTPEGELVAEVDQLTAEVSLAALARSLVDVRRLELDDVRLHLRQDERGLNLSRAVAAKQPVTPAPPSSAPLRWRVQVSGLELSTGAVDTEGLGPAMALKSLHLTGRADVRLEPLRVDGRLSLTASATAPLTAPLSLEVTASSTRGPTALEATLTLGDSRVRASAEWPTQELSVSELVLTPATMKAFVPEYPLAVPLYAKATGSARRAVLQARAGSATLDAAAAWALEPPAVESLSLTLDRADLGEVLGVQRRSIVSASVKASLPDARPASLTGSAAASLTWDAPGLGRLAAATLDATASQGAVRVDALSLEGPAVSLAVRGRVSPKALDVSGRLEAKDLTRTAKVVADFLAVTLPPLGGSGALEVTASGPTTHPAVTARGRLDSLRVDSLSAERVSVDARLPDVSRPLDSNLSLAAARLRAGERALEDVRLDFLTHGRELDVNFTSKGLGDVAVHAAGLLDQDRGGATLSTLELKAAEMAWAMEAPTRVLWGDAVKVEPLSLRDGAQRLRLEGRLARRVLDAHVDAIGVDLARLPHILTPEDWGLAGTVTLSATAKGRLPSPDVDATLSVVKGGARGLRDVDVTLSGAWRGQRVKASGTVRAPLGALDTDLDVSLPAVLDGKDEPVTAKVVVRDVDTEKLAALLERHVPAQGVLSAELSLSGSGAAPVGSLTVEAPSLAVSLDEPPVARPRRFTLDRPRLALGTNTDGTLGAQVSGSAFGGVALVKLQTPFTLKGLRAARPSVDELRDAAVSVDVDLHGVELGQLDDAGLLDDDEVSGVIGLSGSLTGSARRPRGALQLTLARLTTPQVSGVDATVTLSAEAARTTLTGRLQLQGQPAGTLDAEVATAVERLSDLEAVGAAPLQLRGSLYPLELERLKPQHDGALGVRGTVRASVEVTGTLDQPEVELAGSAQALAFSKAALGSARFVVRSTGTEQQLSLALGGQGREDFKVKGTTGLDVRLKTLRHGLAWQAAPVSLALEARELDLGFLSGVTPTVRTVDGALTMTGEVTGTLGQPAYVGDLVLKRGRVGLAGYGDYRDIDLELHATNDLLDLKALRLRAGAGAASLQAKRTRVSSEAFQLTADGSFDRFPLINDDQLVATASLKVSIQGTLSDQLINLTSIDVPRADVELPEVKRKNLQDLVRPKDIIVLRDGQRATRRQRQAARGAATVERDSPATRSIRAIVNAPRNLWVRSSDLNVELGLSEAFRVEVAEATQLFGDAALRQGNLSVIGREFVVQKGSTLRFAGLAKEPYVNVTALHTNEREKVKVTVTVVGKGTDVQLKTSSDPTMTESEIYTLLATGRRELRRGSGASITPGDAVSVVGQLAASQVRNVLAKKLPIDVLNFETSDNFQKVKVDVGTYLTDTVYLGVSAQTGANASRGENPYAARLEWQVTNRWSLEVTGGTAPAGSAEVVWSRDF